MAVIDSADGLFEIVNNTVTIKQAIDSKNSIIAYMADWCNPCVRTVRNFEIDAHMSNRLPEQLSQRNLRLLYVDAENPDLMSPPWHRVGRVPTFYAHIKERRQIGKYEGALTANKFIELMELWYGPIIQP